MDIIDIASGQRKKKAAGKSRENSNKLIVHITSKLLNSLSGCKISEAIERQEFELKTLRFFDGNKKSNIVWSRSSPSNDHDDFEAEIFEPFLLIVLSAEEFVNLIKANQLLSHISSCKEYRPHIDFLTTTLIVQGLKNFCRNNRNKVGMKEIEIHLTQIQLMANCCHRLLETPEDVALTVATMSKSVAEEPTKTKLNEKLMNEQLLFNSDIKCEAKKEDKLSLSNLWQKQITTLGPKVTFEVAESIRKKYPLPKKLIDELNSSPTLSIADFTLIQSNSYQNKDKKRIGPAFDRKLKQYLISENPDEIIK